MCGIAGIFIPGGARRDSLRENVSRMTRMLTHRGPDSGGIWVDHREGIALGHRRLAILDLSEAGHQPFFSASGRYVITYNGEIYNFRELRRRLDYPFRSETDTEVIVAGVEKWGLPELLARLDGMFAFGLWDRRDGQLFLARDKFGEKPLCYVRSGGAIYFASELRALEAVEDLGLEIDTIAQAEFLRFGYVPEPRTIWRQASKLPASHWMKAGSDPHRYWSLPSGDRFTGSERDAEDELANLLDQAVQSRRIAHVPAGVFLSGGIDSGIIATFARPLDTFTIGFTEKRYDESAAAHAVAAHLGVRHHEWIVGPRETLAAIPDLAIVYDEPFADSSQIPVLILARHARTHVKVALCGDGGDELFAGYPRYHQLSLLLKLPHALRTALRFVIAGEKGEMLREAAAATDIAGLYSAIMGGAGSAETHFQQPIEWMCAHDLRNYFVGDLLVKLDRAAMSTGLETRLPMLEPRLVRFVLSLSPSMRFGKKLLRRVLARYLPPEFINRSKRGFQLPIAEWLRGPLKAWAEDLAPGITAELPAGSRCVRIWSRLMLAAWLRERFRRPAAQDESLRLLPEPVAARD